MRTKLTAYTFLHLDVPIIFHDCTKTAGPNKLHRIFHRPYMLHTQEMFHASLTFQSFFYIILYVPMHSPLLYLHKLVVNKKTVMTDYVPFQIKDFGRLNCLLITTNCYHMFLSMSRCLMMLSKESL